MTRSVNPLPDLRAARVAETEDKILRSATELFLERGYAATTLAAVAEAARVAPRTVYVRFGTKAALLKRVVDVAIVGDTALVDVISRDWFQASLTAPTADERIAASARASRGIMARAGGVLAVARQAEAVEPQIAAAAQAGREATRDSVRMFWSRMDDDGLLPATCDLEWLIETTALLAAADTYLLMSSTVGWDPDEYEAWMRATWTRLMACHIAESVEG